MVSVFIWGYGNNFDIVYKALQMGKACVLGVIDSDISQQGKTIADDLKIYAPDEICKEKFDYIVISPFYAEGIMKTCSSMGIDSEKIIHYWGNTDAYHFIDRQVKDSFYLEQDELKDQLKNDNNIYEQGLEKTPAIISSERLLEKIIKDHSSLCRFGDGEFEMIRRRKRPWFQVSSEKLSERLIEVISSDDKKINIAIGDLYGALDKYTEEAAFAMRKYLTPETRMEHYRYLQFNRSYFDAYVTRPYLIYNDKQYCIKIFELWKKIFCDRNMLLVEGMYSRFGVSNNILDSARSIRRIICPPKNAFSKYDSIFGTVRKVAQKDDLILITLGPAATVLAYDLAKAGYQSIDIGQLDNEYDWYHRRAEKQIPIKGKGVAESYVGRVPDEDDDIELSKYKNECIAFIESEEEWI